MRGMVVRSFRLLGIVAVVGLLALAIPSSSAIPGRPTTKACPTNWLRAVRVADIALTGPEEGWAVANHWQAGGTWPITTGCIYRLGNGKWRADRDAPIVPAPYGCYSAVAHTGPTEIWAVGLAGGLYSCQSGSVLVRRHRGRWAAAEIDEVLGSGMQAGTWRPSGLLDIDMVDEDHGWAVTWLAILRFEQGEWAVEFDADCCVYGFSAISMPSLTDGWAGGRCGLYRYDAGVWRRWTDDAFDTAAVSDIDAISPDEAWAVGYSDTHCGAAGTYAVPLVWHYADEQWERVAPDVGAGRLYAVRALGSDDVWAAGELLAPGDEPGGALALRYIQGRWESLPVPSALPLRAIDALAEDSVWAGGDDGFFHYSPGTGWLRRGPEFPWYGGAAPDSSGPNDLLSRSAR